VAKKENEEGAGDRDNAGSEWIRSPTGMLLHFLPTTTRKDAFVVWRIYLSLVHIFLFWTDYPRKGPSTRI
jgi:hypothetical protein